MQESKKQKVYEMICPETDLHGLILYRIEDVSETVKAEIESANDDEVEFNYTIRVKYMTKEELETLPEYQP